MRKRLALLALLSTASLGATSAPAPLDLSSLAKTGEVDPRFQSYNVEMVEVTGGRFWAPYGGPAGELYRMRPPLDLGAQRIRALAKPLGPAFVRISGTWANSTYVPLEGEKVEGIPAGYNQVLTRDQWRGVVGFAKAVDAKIVTSFAASPGVRDADGAWTPVQAQRLLDLTREAGGSIYGAELFNEPSVPPFGGFPKGYKASDFTRDFRLFHAWARKSAPDMKLTGPGSASEGSMLKHTPENEARGFLESENLLRENPGMLDIFSYHYYGSASVRCATTGGGTKERALDPDWLDQTLIDHDFYARLRDRYETGKPIWLNETAQAACGGSPWASTFVDSFRYLNQLGLLAQRGVQVVAHNTLAASDYALIDYDTMMPRPNYWAAILWKRTMGETVLSPPLSPSPDLRLYAHCLPAKNGGVGLLAMNIGSANQTLDLGKAKARQWHLTGDLDTRDVLVNGLSPSVTRSGKLVNLGGVKASGSLTISKHSIAFLVIPNAGNKACR
jgi:heparanase